LFLSGGVMQRCGLEPFYYIVVVAVAAVVGVERH